MELFKTLFYWAVVGGKRSVPVKIIGLALLSGGVSLRYYDQNISFGLSTGGNDDILSVIIALVGLVIFIYQILDDLKKKAIIVQHTGIAEIPTINVDSIRPIWDKVFRPITINHDCDRFYKDGIVTDQEGMLRKTQSIKESIENNTCKTNPEYLKLYYAGLVQVPFAFLAGTIFDNTQAVEIYDWDRSKEKWYRIKKSSKPKIKIDIEHPESTVKKQIAIEIAISYDIDRKNTLETVGDIPIVKIQAQTLAIDNASDIESQKYIAAEFHKILDKYSNIDKIHIFVAAQNSMVFNLGRQVSKRVHPKILVWQYERNGDLQNPWAVSISNITTVFYNNS